MSNAALRRHLSYNRIELAPPRRQRRDAASRPAAFAVSRAFRTAMTSAPA
jgi:hypothetical protein